jgi:hypothetical protein
MPLYHPGGKKRAVGSNDEDCMGGIVLHGWDGTYPVYWYLYVWRKQPPGDGPAASGFIM